MFKWAKQTKAKLGLRLEFSGAWQAIIWVEVMVEDTLKSYSCRLITFILRGKLISY